MRALSVILTGIFLSFHGFCQQGMLSGNDPLFSIGKIVMNYNDFAADSRSVSMPKCTTYRYLPAQKDSVVIGDIMFGDILALISKDKKIKRVYYEKDYVGKDSVYLATMLTNHFTILSSVLTKFYSINPQFYSPNSDTRYFREGLSWQIDKRSIRLVKVWGQIRGSDGKIGNALELRVY